MEQGKAGAHASCLVFFARPVGDRGTLTCAVGIGRRRVFSQPMAHVPLHGRVRSVCGAGSGCCRAKPAQQTLRCCV